MPLSTLDPTPALVAVDLQRGFRGAATAHSLDDVIDRTARLAHAFRNRGLPVVLTTVSGGAPGRTDAEQPDTDAFPEGWTELVDELTPQVGDITLTKERWGAFQDTGLDGELRARNVTQLVLAGMTTSAGIESTARAAHEHGYHVVFVADAITDLDPGLHERSTQAIFPRLGETTTSDELLARIAG